MVKKRLRPGTDVSGVSDEATRVSELPIYAALELPNVGRSTVGTWRLSALQVLQVFLVLNSNNKQQ